MINFPLPAQYSESVRHDPYQGPVSSGLNSRENNFAYLVVNPGAAQAFIDGSVSSGYNHWMKIGRDQGLLFPPAEFAFLTAMARIDKRMLEILGAMTGVSHQVPAPIDTPATPPVIQPSPEIKPPLVEAGPAHTPPPIAPAPEIAPPPIAPAPEIAPLEAPKVDQYAVDPSANFDFERNVQAHTAAWSDVRRHEAESAVPPEMVERLPPYNPQFNESRYLAENPDVEQAVRQGLMESAAHHYYRHGFEEGRNGYVN